MPLEAAVFVAVVGETPNQRISGSAGRVASQPLGSSGFYGCRAPSANKGL